MWKHYKFSHSSKKKHYNAYMQMMKRSSSKTLNSGNGTKVAVSVDNDDPDVEVMFSSNKSYQKQNITEDSSDSAKTQSYINEPKKRNQSTLESCLERSLSFEEGGQKHNEITQDNFPLSYVEKSGLKKFIRIVTPLYKLPSRKTVTRLIENRYVTTKVVLMKVLNEANFLSFTSDILTITNSTRSFLVVTVQFIVTIIEKNLSAIQSINLCAQKLSQRHAAQYIKETWNDLCHYRWWREYGSSSAIVFRRRS